MAMLWQIANRGDLSVQICRIAFDPDFQVRAMVKDPIWPDLESGCGRDRGGSRLPPHRKLLLT